MAASRATYGLHVLAMPVRLRDKPRCTSSDDTGSAGDGSGPLLRTSRSGSPRGRESGSEERPKPVGESSRLPDSRVQRSRRWIADPWWTVSEDSSRRGGMRQRRPGKRAKSPSSVIHSQPDSMAIAAKYASGMRFPFASAFMHRPEKISQWRRPGLTGTACGCASRTLANLMACSRGDGRAKMRGSVTMRRKPLTTRPDVPNGSWPVNTD